MVNLSRVLKSFGGNMLLKSNVFRLLLSFCLVLCLSFAALADTIRLKDGSVIKGRIVGFRDGQFLVQIGDGARARQMTFFADEIDAIEFDANSAVNKVAQNTNAGAPNTILPKPPVQASNSQTGATNDNNKDTAGQGNGVRPSNQQPVSPNTNSV